MEGTILDKTGPVSFRVRLLDGRIWKRHIDHVRIRYPEHWRRKRGGAGGCSPPERWTKVAAPPLQTGVNGSRKQSVK